MKHKITQTMVVHAAKQYGSDEYKLTLMATDMSAYGYIALGNVEINVDHELPDDFNFTQCEIDMMRKEQKRIKVESQMKVTQLEEQIQKLLCLENKQ